VTVAAVIERDGRFLLVEEHTPEGLRLNNPAGHLEEGETPLQAVCREALEETARVFEPQHLLGVYLARFQREATGEDVTYLRLAYAGGCGEQIVGREPEPHVVGSVLWGGDALQVVWAQLGKAGDAVRIGGVVGAVDTLNEGHDQRAEEASCDLVQHQRAHQRRSPRLQHGRQHPHDDRVHPLETQLHGL